jgi:hypothetical protein
MRGRFHGYFVWDIELGLRLGTGPEVHLVPRGRSGGVCGDVVRLAEMVLATTELHTPDYVTKRRCSWIERGRGVVGT